MKPGTRSRVPGFFSYCLRQGRIASPHIDIGYFYPDFIDQQPQVLLSEVRFPVEQSFPQRPMNASNIPKELTPIFRYVFV